MTAPHWEVQIIRPQDGKPKRWDVYPTRERAEAIVAHLTKHGIRAMVRTVYAEPEPPEHNNERRRFLVWAVLAGFAQPERLTERIVNEIEQETAAT